MPGNLRYVGLDVHAETIAVAEPDGEVRCLGIIPNRLETATKLVRTLRAHRFSPKCAKGLRQRQRGQPEVITALAWQAQQRLCGRYRRLLGRGKPTPHVITAVARELVGFIWAIGVAVERQQALAA